ncbi:MAG: isopenicillin N synthase family oxygenase [Alphaproteobacteria bacterium]|nr:isopenicillin N synthase family oxygenase [Alphaproteobacteria bacterium]
MTHGVPVIDLSPYFAGGPGKDAVARETAAACEEIGFLVIDGHGVAPALVAEMFEVGRALFDLPQPEKELLRPRDGVAPRGYHALGTKYLARTLGQDTPPDLREQFYIGPLAPDLARIAHLPQAAKFYQPNIWPERPADFRRVATRYYAQMERLARDLMRVFALALGLEETYFDSRIDNHFATLPLNHYPEPQEAPLPGQLRAGEHSDFGSLTILALDDAPGGLQVKQRDGSWLDVTAAPGQFIVNLGDMMQRWSNDRWRSTLHRVVNPPFLETAQPSRRMSIGFFLHPNYDAVISSLPGCLVPGEPAKYPPVLAGELMRSKMEARAA